MIHKDWCNVARHFSNLCNCYESITTNNTYEINKLYEQNPSRPHGFLEKELDKMNTEIKQLREENEKLKEWLTNREDELNRRVRQLNSSDSERLKLREENEKLRKQFIYQANKCTNLEAKIKDNLKQYGENEDEMYARIGSLEEEIDKLKRDNEIVIYYKNLSHNLHKDILSQRRIFNEEEDLRKENNKLKAENDRLNKLNKSLCRNDIGVDEDYWLKVHDQFIDRVEETNKLKVENKEQFDIIEKLNSDKEKLKSQLNYYVDLHVNNAHGIDELLHKIVKEELKNEQLKAQLQKSETQPVDENVCKYNCDTCLDTQVKSADLIMDGGFVEVGVRCWDCKPESKPISKNDSEPKPQDNCDPARTGLAICRHCFEEGHQ